MVSSIAKLTSALVLLVGLVGAPTAEAAPVAPVARVTYAADDHLILAPVGIVGHGRRTYRFLVDTGARHTVVDWAVARALGLRSVWVDRMTGAGKGSVPMQHAAPLVFSLGAARLAVADPWIIDLNHPETAGHIDGLLGADFFAKYIVRVDPVRHTLEAIGPSTFSPVRMGRATPLIFAANRLFVYAKLTVGQTTVTHRIRIDTGSSDALSDDIVRTSHQRVRSRQGVGLGTSYIDYSGVIDLIAIGPYAVVHSWGASNDRPALGMEILRRFTFTVDVPHRVLYLSPNEHLRDPVPAPSVHASITTPFPIESGNVACAYTSVV